MGLVSEVFNKDCMEGMREYPNKFFELAIVDPEYGINQGGDKNHTRGLAAKSKKYKPFDDSSPEEIEYFNQLRRVSQNQIIWGANHFISRIPFDSSCWIVWDKHMEAQDFADCELAWTSFKTAVKKFEYAWNGMIQGNMRQKEIRIHPTQKPVALYKWLLKNYAKEGDKILDTHLGSGSSRIAAYDMGFDFTGFEIDEDYFNSAEKRFQLFKSQQKLEFA